MSTYNAEHKQISIYNLQRLIYYLQNFNEYFKWHMQVLLFLLLVNDATYNKLSYQLLLHTFDTVIQSEISSVPNLAAPHYTCC